MVILAKNGNIAAKNTNKNVSIFFTFGVLAKFVVFRNIPSI